MSKPRELCELRSVDPLVVRHVCAHHVDEIVGGPGHEVATHHLWDPDHLRLELVEYVFMLARQCHLDEHRCGSSDCAWIHKHHVLVDDPRFFESANSRFGMAQRLRDELELPVLVIDGDLADVRFFSTAQTMTNIEAFVEQLEGRQR